MGQYHLTANLTKREILDPHKLGDGLKLSEQVNSEGGICAALLILLAASNGRGGGDFDDHGTVVGRWAGDRIVVIGDYGEEHDLPAEFGAGSLHDRCRLGQEFPQLRVASDNGQITDADEVLLTLSGQIEDHFPEGLPRGPDGDLLPIDFRDISDIVLPVLERECRVKFTSREGWRSKEREDGSDARRASRPDMVIGGSGA